MKSIKCFSNSSYRLLFKHIGLSRTLILIEKVMRCCEFCCTILVISGFLFGCVFIIAPPLYTLFLSRLPLIYNVFLFLKAVLVCVANAFYSVMYLSRRSQHQPLVAFLYEVALPMIIHLLISKWELAIYLALPFNLTVMFFNLDGDNDYSQRCLRLCRNFVLMSVLLPLIF